MSGSTPRIEEYSWGQMEWLADHASDPGVGASLVRMVVNVGASSPKHRHDNCSEILHLLEGSVTVPIGEDDRATLSAGDTHVFSAHTPHSVHNNGSSDAVLMLAFSSGNRQHKPLEAESN